MLYVLIGKRFKENAHTGSSRGGKKSSEMETRAGNKHTPWADVMAAGFKE